MKCINMVLTVNTVEIAQNAREFAGKSERPTPPFRDLGYRRAADYRIAPEHDEICSSETHSEHDVGRSNIYEKKMRSFDEWEPCSCRAREREREITRKSY